MKNFIIFTLSGNLGAIGSAFTTRPRISPDYTLESLGGKSFTKQSFPRTKLNPKH